MKISCNCGGESFEVYENVYSNRLVPYEHLEIVCKKCGFGFIAVRKEVMLK